MAINLNNKVSEEDKRAVRNSFDSPEYREGFEPENSSEDYDKYFDSVDSGDEIFGSFNVNSQDDGFANLGLDNTDNQGFGDTISTNVFDNTSIGQSQQKEPDVLDKAFDTTIESTKKAYKLLAETVNSAKTKTADDFGYFGTSLIKVGAVIDLVSVIALLIGIVSKLGASYKGLCINGFIAGCFCISLGMVSLGVSALVLCRLIVNEPNKLEDIRAIKQSDENSSEDIDSDFSSLFDFDDDDEDEETEYELSDSFDDNETPMKEEEADDLIAAMFNDDKTDDIIEEPKEVDYNSVINDIRENSYLTRQTLVDTFVPLLRKVTPNFSTKAKIDKYDDTFITIDTICKKVMANILNCKFSDIEDDIEQLNETVYSYEIYFKRTRKINKLTDIEKELEAYFRSNSRDKSVTASVDIEGDFYRMVVSKGDTSIITLGDVLGIKEYRDFFNDSTKKLPIVSGITNMGEPILNDAKVFDSMVIAGKPRSGKSWYILSIIMQIVMFNTPEQVQIILIDPKGTNLFRQLALLPHVCGLHDEKKIISILDDVIENEAPRRKKILADNKCDDIWALWDKGIILPILYVVIDEYLTVKNSLGDNSKELDNRLQVLIAQLPSLGIRVMFIPHRMTGIVDKTNRTMLHFKAAVRSEVSEIKETLDIAKWDKPLINPGDTALKTSELPDAVQVRSAVIETSDSKNSEFIRMVAKAFYKMGVDVPDMSNMRVACNRDIDDIREELSGEKLTQQFNINNWDM